MCPVVQAPCSTGGAAKILARVACQVREAPPVGAPRAARPNYEIADAYLSFWFTVLYTDITSVEAGQATRRCAGGDRNGNGSARGAVRRGPLDGPAARAGRPP